MAAAGLNSLGSSSMVQLRNAAAGGAKSTNTTMTMTSINGFRDTNGSLIAQTSNQVMSQHAIPIMDPNSSFYNQKPKADRSKEAYRRGHQYQSESYRALNRNSVAANSVSGRSLPPQQEMTPIHQAIVKNPRGKTRTIKKGMQYQ